MTLVRVQSLYLFHSIILILSFPFPLYFHCIPLSYVCLYFFEDFYTNRYSSYLFFGGVFVFTSILLLDLFCQLTFLILSCTVRTKKGFTNSLFSGTAYAAWAGRVPL